MLAALCALLSELAGGAAPHPAAGLKFRAVRDALDPNLFAGITKDEAEFMLSLTIARLRRSMEIIENPDQFPAWTTDDPVIMQTQGKASRIATRLITEFAQKEASLSQLLSAPNRFLDVGSGAGWISLSMAEQWPKLHTDGLEIHPPALELAKKNAFDVGLSDRVVFHNRSVDKLEVKNEYAAAFIPFIFVPELILHSAIPALATALKVGAWLFIACYRKPESPVDIALWDLQTTMSGGRVWDENEITRLVGSSGFGPILDLGVGTPINMYATRRL
jgi:SAM-dependent methyltransferase